MTLAELQYLVTLAQERHFGRAAESCGVSQPALSSAIKKLEEELDVQLFNRARAHIDTTAVGDQVVSQARRVLESVAAIHNLANAGGDHLSAPLAVGALFTVGPYLLPQCMPHLQKPGVELALQTEQGTTSTLRAKLRRGDLDAIVVSLPFAEPDVLVQPLFSEPFVVLLPQRHPLAAKAEIDPLDLDARNTLLLEEGHCLRDQVIAACSGLSASPAKAAGTLARTGCTLEMLRNMVAHEQGITVLPLSAATILSTGHHNLITRPFKEPVPSRTLALAWRASFPRHRAIDALRQAIESCSIAYSYYTTNRETDNRGILVDNSHW